MATKVPISKRLEYAHLNFTHEEWDAIDFKKLRDPLYGYKSIEDCRVFAKAIRDPRNFYFTLKYVFNIEPSIFQLVILQELWNTPNPMFIASRGASKSWTFGLYALMKAVLCPGSKVVLVSASFRQSKNMYTYAANILKNAPVLRDIIGENYKSSEGSDMWKMEIGTSTIIAVPLGTSGDKIRGLRANVILVDEYQSMSEEIFETVISPFASVSSDPSENVKKMARVKLLKEEGEWTDAHQEALDSGHRPNQIILAGTGDWDFKHFAKYWKKWHDTITNRELTEVHGYKRSHYKVIRLPWEVIPDGFMEAEHIQKAKATANNERFMCEYGAIFPKDSTGFFKRSLIESCVAGDKNPIILPGGPVTFHARLNGDFNNKYIYGIDPASEADNLAIVILEMHPDHNRVVYCWTVKRTNMRQKDAANKENDFYQFIARKVRSLMRTFPCEVIALDSQGGGIGVMEALHNLKSLEHGEVPIWPITEDHILFTSGCKNWGYDAEMGKHIIEMVSMAKTDYVVEANHGLKKDMQDKVLLFPFIDPLEIGFAEMGDLQNKISSGDTLKECLMEIEELKEELSTIAHTTTQNGRDRWDTPETMMPGNKKGRLRKDRYSALLMANAAARRLNRPTTIDHQRVPAGGFAHMMKGNKIDPDAKMYTGPDWFVNGSNMSGWGTAIRRGR